MRRCGDRIVLRKMKNDANEKRKRVRCAATWDDDRRRAHTCA